MRETIKNLVGALLLALVFVIFFVDYITYEKYNLAILLMIVVGTYIVIDCVNSIIRKRRRRG